MREVERQSQISETKYLQSKQEYVSKIGESEMKADFAG